MYVQRRLLYQRGLSREPDAAATDFLVVGWRMVIMSMFMMIIAASFYWPLLEN